MTKSVHHGGAPANVSPINDGSPAQQALMADIADELARLRALELRAMRLVHVREGGDAHTLLQFVRFSIQDAFFAAERARRIGGRLALARAIGEGSVLSVVPPPAKVIDLDAYRQKRAAAG